MRKGPHVRSTLLKCFLAAALAVLPAHTMAIQKGAHPENSLPTGERVVDDSGTSHYWDLVRDPYFRGGPGHWVDGGSGSRAPSDDAAERAHSKVIIHTGDRVVLQESTDQVHLRIQAIALAQGTAGSVVPVRLGFWGALIRVRAVAPGVVEFLPDAGGTR